MTLTLFLGLSRPSTGTTVSKTLTLLPGPWRQSKRVGMTASQSEFSLRGLADKLQGWDSLYRRGHFKKRPTSGHRNLVGKRDNHRPVGEGGVGLGQPLPQHQPREDLGAVRGQWGWPLLVIQWASVRLFRIVLLYGRCGTPV
jgi:hypothetical protein